MLAIIALVLIAIVALTVLSFAVHVLFSPWLLLAVVGILAWAMFRPRRSRQIFLPILELLFQVFCTAREHQPPTTSAPCAGDPLYRLTSFQGALLSSRFAFRSEAEVRD